MSSLRNPGRQAGFLYLFLVVVAPFALIYIPDKLIVRGNATATANNVLAHETLFRLGIAVGLMSTVIFILLVMALYRLLRGVNQTQASLMAVLALVSSAVGFMNALNNLAALLLFRGADFLTVVEKAQRDALAMLFLRLDFQGDVINEILWGLWLLPLAMLVYRSRFLPRFLGVWLFINGVAYVIISFVGLLLPQYYGVVFNRSFPALLGEMALMLWLVIKGAKPQPSDAAASVPAVV
jgi:hypothetical protein